MHELKTRTKKHKSQYDVTIESCTVQKFSAKIDLPFKQTTKIHKNHNSAAWSAKTFVLK